ncbi:hypothetical protein ACFLTZ_04125 [Chloroflexota bacterium]
MTEYKKEEFTYAYYREFLSCLSEIYGFVNFTEGKKIISNSDQTVKDRQSLAILRHDIDMDLKPALTMSLIEKDMGLKATYFFMVTCPIYNVFSSIDAECVRQILSFGHHLGLHFDFPAYKDISPENLSFYIARECELLEKFFEHPVDAVSFHRWGSLKMNEITLENIPNTYERVFLDKFQYFSDSRSRWARGNPIKSEAFSKRENLHLLTHPIWWGDTVTAPYERLTSLTAGNKLRAEQYLAANCDVWNEGIKAGNK